MNTDISKQMEMVLYRTEDDNVTVSALIKDETIWITQKAMAELFGVQTPAISKHLKNFFEQGELREDVVVSKRVCENFSVNRILRSSMIKYKIIGGLILWQEKRNRYTKYK